MKKLLEEAARRAIDYRQGLADRAVAADPVAIDALSAFDEPLSEDGTSELDTLQLLDEYGSPATLGMTSPRFFGFVIGGSMPVTLAANWLATAWDQNAVLNNVTPAVSRLEQVSMEWMKQLFGLPASTGAAFVTGATVANFTALAAARGAVLARAGWDVRADGLFGAREIAVIVGGEAHPTLLKALSMLGLGERRVTSVPVDGQGRLRPEAMPTIRGPTIVCTQAGNINSGAFDPVGTVCEIAHADGAWVHVDGAFGLWAAAVPGLRHLCEGIESADSWAVDAHKWLNVPYDCGMAFVRDPEALRDAMAVTASYLPTDSAARNPADYTPELSRRARGVEVWAALRTLGRGGIVSMIEDSCRHARRFANELSAAGFEVLNEVVLNQVVVAFGDRDTTLAVIDAIQKDGTCWCGSTQWQGRTAMRISVSNWATRDDDVTASLSAIIRIAKSMTG